MIAYRRDIDGLRGVAVLQVLLYHAGAPFVSGGFTGVDVFFVISGFLITSLIVGSMDRSEFSFVDFYDRRARRILPALYVSLSTTLVLGLFLQLPRQLSKMASAAIMAVLFSSNVYFWRTSGYFSDDSELLPVLHTWSLGVEEQFYIFFPLLLLPFHRKGRRALALLILPLLVLSLAASVFGTYRYQWAAYYLLPSRAWQLMSGALLAVLALKPTLNPRWSLAFGVVGLVMIVAPMFLYSNTTRFPGLAALVPTMGTALLILTGSGDASPVSRLLASRSLVWVGQISYSLYLWHWPVFAFTRTVYASANIPPLARTAGFVLSIFLAFLSWKYVEQPFRSRKTFSRRAIFKTALVTSGLLLLALGVVRFAQGFPQRVGLAASRLEDYGASADVLENVCMQKTAVDISAGRVCEVNQRSPSAAHFAIWGDSHASAVRGEAERTATIHNVRGFFFGRVGCPPLLGVERQLWDGGRKCLDFNTAVARHLCGSASIKTVVLYARWGVSSEGTYYRYEVSDPTRMAYILKDAQSTSSGLEENHAVFRRGMRRTLEQLRSCGKSVVIVGPTPEVGWNVPRVLANGAMWGITRRISPTLDEFTHRQHYVLRTIRDLAAAGLARVVWPHEVFCRAGQCAIEYGGEPLYIDDDHVSDAGAKLVVELIESHLR